MTFEGISLSVPAVKLGWFRTEVSPISYAFRPLIGPFSRLIVTISVDKMQVFINIFKYHHFFKIK